MKRMLTLAIALMGILSLAACSDDVTAPEAADKTNTSLEPTTQTIAEIADAAGFSLLLGAVDYIAQTNPASNTVARLLDDSALTVFAPTDQAFLDLVTAVEPLLDQDVLEAEGPFAAIDDLLGTGTIEAVVSYHVTGGNRDAASLVPARGDREIKTLLLDTRAMITAEARIEAVGNSAQITATDIYASNGIIHVIDTVILPVVLDLAVEGKPGGLERTID
jgi:uncharacterized surface protein with fasciclin (FAS1) repeats